MYNIGVVPGKFFPPHRGHLYQIIRAATKCHKLYVVVSDSDTRTLSKCMKDGLPYIPLKMRALWISKEFQNVENIQVLTLDETGMPDYPDGSEPWSNALKRLIPKFDIIFGGDLCYRDTYMQHFPGIHYEVWDYKRSRYPVSGTEVRSCPLVHWDYILGSARPFFARRVLIAGTESCGKTTLTKYLAKIFHTSWSEEYGRYYARDFLGGNEALFTLPDFERIARIQRDQDDQALRDANRVVFFDSDAVITQYYCELYLGCQNPEVERFIDPQRYDIVLMLGPQVPWVPDGSRFKSEQEERERLHNRLLYMYMDRGFKDKIHRVDTSSYEKRLEECITIVDRLLADPNFMKRY